MYWNGSAESPCVSGETGDAALPLTLSCSLPLSVCEADPADVPPAVAAGALAVVDSFFLAPIDPFLKRTSWRGVEIFVYSSAQDTQKEKSLNHHNNNNKNKLKSLNQTPPLSVRSQKGGISKNKQKIFVLFFPCRVGGKPVRHSRIRKFKNRKMTHTHTHTHVKCLRVLREFVLKGSPPKSSVGHQKRASIVATNCS